MTAKRTFSILSTAETRFARAQWLRSGRCLRCFHSSHRVNAEEQTRNGTSGADISPRRKRAAAVTDELSALAREPVKRTNTPSRTPSLSPRPAQNKTAVPQGASVLQDSAKHSVQAPSLSASDLLRSGQGTATIAGSNIRGVLVDRFRLIRDYDQHQTRNGPRPQLVAKAENGEDTAVAKLPDSTVQWGRYQRQVASKLVLGNHEGDDVFNGKEKYKQGTLNMVARAMTLNSSYLGADTARFVNKVRSLVPAGVIARPQKATVKPS